MRTYEELGDELRTLIGDGYDIKYQPKSATKLTYPCILYELSKVDVRHAEDKPYLMTKRYRITHIYKSIDNELIEEFLNAFDYVSYDNRQIVDGLYHDYYTIYY